MNDPLKTTHISDEQVNGFNFGTALMFLEDGYKLARKGWNGVGMHIKLQVPDERSKMTLPYIYIEYPINPKHHAYPNGSRCPWIASQTDMLAKDWFVVLEEN